MGVEHGTEMELGKRGGDKERVNSYVVSHSKIEVTFECG